MTGREELTNEADPPKLIAVEGERVEEDEEEGEDREDRSSSGSDKKRRRARHHEVKSIGFPRPLLKMIVCSESEDLLGMLRHALEVSQCRRNTLMCFSLLASKGTIFGYYSSLKERLLAPREAS